MMIASIETSTDEEDIANGDTYKVRLEVDKNMRMRQESAWEAAIRR